MDKNNISVVIPTLQKNIEVLNKLLDSLVADLGVAEIIVIDNSTKGLDYKHDKIRVIIPKENLYVNPSWNLGVKEAKSDIVALLNDDIILPDNFCSDVVSNMNNEMGVVGFCMYNVIPVDKIIQQPYKTRLSLEEANYMDFSWGITIFFYKSSYVEIPNDLKINYGDAWLISRNKKLGRKNYRIVGQNIYHVGSLTSSQKCFSEVHKKDAKLYNKLTVKWYNRIYSFEEHWDCWRLRLMRITFKFNKKRTRTLFYE